MKSGKESFSELNECGELSKEDLDKLDLEYCELIDKYHELWEIEKRKMERPGFVALSEDEIYGMTKPRDDLHKKLLELGVKLGYSKDVVQMDILSREGNLGAYGLPEFGIINHDERNSYLAIHLYKDPSGKDFFTDRFFSRRAYEQLVDSTMNYEQEIEEDMEKLEVKRTLIKVGDETIEEYESKMEKFEEDGMTWRNGLRAGECTIIFAVSYLNNCPSYDFFMQLFVPDDFYEKRRRAMLLAKEFGFEMFSNEAYAPHAPLNYIGVVVPSSRLQEVAVKLFHNREKFGIRKEDLGNTPQTEQDKERIEEEKIKVIRNYLVHYGFSRIDEELMPADGNYMMTDEERDVWLSRRDRWESFIKNMPVSELKNRYGVLIKKYEEARKAFFGYGARPIK